MKKRIVMWKNAGETPLEALGRLKNARPDYRAVPLAYAGRLDPMADGLLLVLTGDECKKAQRYRGLDKEYQVEVLIGAGTDTGDALGLPSLTEATLPTRKKIEEALRKEEGLHEVPYPAYSSKTVRGKPLFLYALSGTLDSISIPTHPERIYRIRLECLRDASPEELSRAIRAKIMQIRPVEDPKKRLGRDFRRQEILDAWDGALHGRKKPFRIATIRVTAGSGAYMRSLAKRIGENLGTGALAYRITRTRIGRFRALGPVGIWTPRYALTEEGARASVRASTDAADPEDRID